MFSRNMIAKTSLPEVCIICKKPEPQCSPGGCSRPHCPAAGASVTIAQRRGYFWYAPGVPSRATTAIAGESYFINTLGNTDFTQIGAAENKVGILFIATGPGTGTGSISTVSNGIALQQTNTQAARFLRGL